MSDPKRKIWKYIVYPIIVLVLMFIALVVYVNSREADLHNTVLIIPNQFTPDSNACLNLIIKKGHTDMPISGADIAIKLKSKITAKVYDLGKFKTNPSGMMADPLQIPDIPEGEYFLCIDTSSSYGNDSIEEPIQIHRTFRLLLTTDKPLYQPNQIIHIKSICLNNFDLKPMVDTPITLEIEDPKGNKIFKKSLNTSAYGIIATDFTLADEINLGEYLIRARAHGAETEKIVTVSKYDLPKFKIAVKTDKAFYLPEEIVKGTINARYFFDKPVANGSVRIEFSAFTEKFEVFKTLAGKTDPDGIFNFETKLPDKFFGTPVAKGDALLKVEATIKDSAGQTEKSVLTFSVAKDILKITAIPESGELVPGIENIVYLVTTYPDGNPAGAKIYVSLSDGNQIAQTETDKFGIGEIRLLPTISASFIISGTDSQGIKGKLKIKSENSPNFFLARPNKAIYRSGDNMIVTVLSKEKTGIYYLDIVKDRQTVLTKIIEVKDNLGTLTFGLPLELNGLITLSAYRILTGGNIMRDTRVVFVEPDNQLTIKTEKNKKTYLPGETAKLTLQVTDANGNPVQAVLGLSFVDESVFVLAESEPGLHRVYYEIEKEVIRPRFQIKYFSNALFTPLPGESKEGNQQKNSALMASLEPIFLPSKIHSSFQEKSFKIGREIDEFNETIENIPHIIGIALLYIIGFISFFLAFFFYPLRYAIINKYKILGIVIVAAWIISAILIWLLRQQYYSSFLFTVSGIIGGGLIIITICYVLFAILVSVTSEGLIGKLSVLVLFSFGLIFFINIIPNHFRMETLGKELGSGSHYRYYESAGFIGQNAHYADWGQNQSDMTARVRQYFPETLFWQPELITDEKGQLQVNVPLADSITTWRTMIDSISKEGKLGSTQNGITVFQDFFIDLNLPRTLTQNDEISVPIVVHNYLPKPQDIALTVQAEGWFTALEPLTKTLQLAPNEVGSAYFRLRISDFGIKELTIYAQSESGFQDAIKKSLEILPNGKEIHFAIADRLGNQVTQQITIPDNAVDNASTIQVKIYPGVYAAVVEGFERLLKLPYGCFEQTSSITYPNVLLYDYLKQTEQLTPKISMKLEQAINLGYQRLLKFEVSGGGFSLFDNAPAEEFLTAYGLLEFTDMSKVYRIDKDLIERTENWLMSKQKSNGMWGKDINQTAYTAWALLESGVKDQRINRTLDYMRSQNFSGSNNYKLALCANAFAAYNPDDPFSRSLIKLLETTVTEATDVAFWKSSNETLMSSSGMSGAIENTAIAAYALIKGKGNTQIINKALSFLVTSRDSDGGWFSTQATIWSIKALLASLTQTMPTEQEINVTVKANQQPEATFKINKNNYNVVQQISFSQDLRQGANFIKINCDKESNLAYQIVGKYYLDWNLVPQPKPNQEGLTLSVDYDKSSLNVNDKLTCRIKCTCNSSLPTGMVLLDLGIPPGFAPDTSTIDNLIGLNGITKYSFTGRQITIYIANMTKRMTLNFSYTLKALYPIKAQTPVSKAYEYYNPESPSIAKPVLIEIK